MPNRGGRLTVPTSVLNRDSLHLRTGQKLGSYELLAPVARGASGQVWAARLRGAHGFNKLVAIKTLPAGMEQRLLDEARTAALVQHSNVIQTLELGEEQSTLYLALEWVDGEPLDVVMQCAKGAFGVPFSAAIHLVAQALRGLQAAHERGVVHGALSARDLIVSHSGIVKWANFGIARESSVADPRADLFGLGVILYELTTGVRPFEGAGDEPAIRPSLIKPGYSRTLEAVVMKAIDRDRDRRWPSAEEMRLALQRGVPQAFELGVEGQLASFMADTLGESAQRKREALRRFELVVDAGRDDVANSGPPSSATSLRAIALDTGEETAPSAPPRAMPSVPPVPWRRPLVVAALAFAALALGLLWSRPASRHEHVAAPPGAGMVELSASVKSSRPVAAPSTLPSALPSAKRRP